MHRYLLPILAILVALTIYPAWVWKPTVIETAGSQLADRYLGPELEVETASALVDLMGTVHSIEVVVPDNADGSAESITVVRGEQQDWLIASKWNYPADGEKQVGTTIGSVLGVRKVREIPADKGRHDLLGVLDPRDDEAGVKGRGKRVTLKGKDGGVILDVIIGERAEGGEATYYVRDLGDGKIYTAQLVPKDPSAKYSNPTLDITARFIDWVKDNPFKVAKTDIRQLVIDKYSLDLRSGERKDLQTIELVKPAAAEKWAVEQGLPPGKQLKEDEVGRILDRLGWLRLADVEKYAGLSGLDLQNRGFFVTQNQQLIPTEGSIVFRTKEGLTYRLAFGFPSAEKTEAATGDDGTTDQDQSDRVMFVQLFYDPAQDETIPPEPEQPEPAPEATEEEQAKAAEQFKQAKEAWLKKRDEHLAAQKKKVEELNAKYLSYFFVIRDYDFQTLRPDIDRLLEDQPDPAAANDDAAPTAPQE